MDFESTVRKTNVQDFTIFGGEGRKTLIKSYFQSESTFVN